MVESMAVSSTQGIQSMFHTLPSYLSQYFSGETIIFYHDAL
jgi:hypothetical protein